MSDFPPPPEPFLQVLVSELDLDTPLRAFCAGYELGRWRSTELVRHAMEWLPEFALSAREVRAFNSSNGVKLLHRAANAVYNTDKYKKRGEFGELLLHICIRQECETIPAVSKLFFKDSPNDVVKGYDCVHAVQRTKDLLDLWLGEAKFYEDLAAAARDAAASIHEHMDSDYLRQEFAAILNKVDDDTPHAERLRKLLDEHTSLDDVFDSIVVPVLLTYDSSAVADHSELSDAFKMALESEVRSGHTKLTDQDLPNNIRVSLFVVPLENKKAFVAAIHQELQRWQTR